MQALRELARTQLGLVTTSQAIAAGTTRRQLEYAVKVKTVSLVQPKVYLFGFAPTFEQRVMAACLACGDGAAASHLTAGHLWSFLEGEPDILDVSVTTGRRKRLTAVRIHRTRRDSRSDFGSRRGIPITSAARTLLDIAGVLVRANLELACDEAFRRQRITPDRLLEYLDACDEQRQAGVTELRSIARDRSERGVPESALETIAAALLKRSGLPEPVRQFQICLRGRKIRFDFAYPDQRLAIELDGRAPHWGRDRWQSDHDRQNLVEVHGWRVLRFTWWDVNDRPQYVVHTIAEALDLRPARWVANSHAT